MAIRKFRAGQSSYSADTYVGTHGTIFYNEDTGELRLSDGITPGGVAIPITLATSTVAGSVKLGPGVVLNTENQIIIDSTGLDFNFGDFQAITEPDGTQGATLKAINSNQDINFESNGTGVINVIGEFSVYKPDHTVAGAMIDPPIFQVKNDGQVHMLVPGADSTEGAVSIIGGLDGVFQPPVNIGVMLHITGIAGTPDPVPSRLYNDAQASFAAFVARRYNGTAVSPSAVLDGEEIMRLSGTAHNGLTIPGSGNTRIVYKALGNQTLVNQGGTIELWTTPLNSITLTKVASIDNANGITSTKFVGPLTGSVKSTNTGNTILDTSAATAVFTGNVTGNVSGTAPAGLLTGTTLASNVVTSSLTAVGALTSGSIGVGFTAIANARLANSTISGIALGNNLAALTIGTHLTGTSYNGSTGITIATDATTDATASVLVARDSNGLITAQNYKGNTRDVGTLGAGGTLTINYATDHHVLVNITGAITISHQNITAGRNVKVVIINATGTNLAVNTGVSDQNTTGGNNNANLNATRMGVYEYISYGTTTATLYANVNK